MILRPADLKKMVKEHADFTARSTAWGGKFQRTKQDRIGNMETPSLATVRAIPAEEEVG